jgi:hypothetical protein
MTTCKDEQFEKAVASLGDLIGLMCDRGLHETAQFLAMAKLQLQMDLHGVTDEEFRALCLAIEAEAGGTRHAPARLAKRRPLRTDARSPDHMHLRETRPRAGGAPRGKRSRVKQ